MFFSGNDIGIDLGTASILVFVKGKGIALCEPSVVAIDKNTGKTLAIGAEAQSMLGRTPGNIIAVRPLREGVISDYEMTEKMIKHFIKKVLGFRLFKPNVVICIPSVITEVEERAVIDAGEQAGARRVYLIEEPVAAAIGAGVDIAQPNGNMIVDIGGADGSGHGLFDEVHPAGAGLLAGVNDGALFHLGDDAGDTDHHVGLEQAEAQSLFDKMLDHLFGHFVVGNDALTQGTHRDDVAGS